ncbi:MAG TPA: Uma2 family endonuclease [Methylomirabilota bacterium]|nr:Uma2 family endonuclease [Methylomirabilota bacterium]
MSDPYEEIIEGVRVLRFAPGPRHEQIVARLHQRVALAVAGLHTSRMLPPRAPVRLSPDNIIRPDLALVTTATEKLWLAAEVISSEDHHADTVDKKSLYQELRLPRVWMVDPRYDNVEVYHGTAHGLALKHILSQRELLTEALLPGFQFGLHELFAGGLPSAPGQYGI